MISSRVPGMLPPAAAEEEEEAPQPANRASSKVQTRTKDSFFICNYSFCLPGLPAL